MMGKFILILLFVFCMVLAGLFAGVETGMYQLSRLRLRLGVVRKRLSYLMLGRSLHDSPALLLSMLIGTNIAHYLTTSIITLLLLEQLQVEHTAEIFATVVTAPLLFVFTELIPKNTFFYRADALMPFFSFFIFISHKLFVWSGVVPLLKYLSGLFSRLIDLPRPSEAATAMRQPYIKAMVRDITEEAFLSTIQTDIMARLASISHLAIRSVMTPLNKVQMVDINSDRPALLGKLKNSTFTRLPVYEHRPSNIVGFINIYEVLTSSAQFNDLHDFVKPIYRLQASTVVSDALNIVRSKRYEIILVTRTPRVGRERPIGIVTTKDLVEELLGELAEW